MINLIKALSASAFVVSIVPTAFAEPGQGLETKETVIEVTGKELPTSAEGLEYPYRAAERGMDGNCEILVEVSSSGEADKYDVISCSHASFRAAADRFAKSLEFAPTGEAVETELMVSWSIED